MDKEREKLESYFKLFPGIGPRQARRFVYFLLRKDRRYVDELIRLIRAVKQKTRQCSLCQRFFEDEKQSHTCHICSEGSRDTHTLLLIEKDADLETIERSHEYKGLYFVLGGLIPILEKQPHLRIRESKLTRRIREDKEIKEVIIALAVNQDGDNTAEYIKKILKPIAEERAIKISTLGRGLSTGTELEYSDSDTFKNAFKHRE